MNKHSGKKVAVAMSGGVDSAVSAYLLQQQGFQVQAFFMRNWSPLTDIKNDCPWQKDFEDVRRVCQFLHISYATFNFEKEYKERVLSNFLNEYQAGRTPNPDVLCNREVKFDLFLKNIKALGFDYMATGHYAKVQDNTLVRPKDTNKDQTYFLCHLTQQQISSVTFPLADLTKDEVRAIAAQAGLPNARKKDSQGICFIGKVPVRQFLKNNLDLKPGNVVDKNGIVLGIHEGAQLYTIGQRHVGVATPGQALYVISKDIPANTVTLGPEQDLLTDNLKFTDANWLIGMPNEFKCTVQLRYRTTVVLATVNKQRGSVQLDAPTRAVTPGQFVAFFDENKLIGAGVID